MRGSCSTWARLKSKLTGRGPGEASDPVGESTNLVQCCDVPAADSELVAATATTPPPAAAGAAAATTAADAVAAAAGASVADVATIADADVACSACRMGNGYKSVIGSLVRRVFHVSGVF